MRYLITPLILSLLLVGCTTTESAEIETSSLILTAEGPLFEGNNTATLEWSPDNSFWGENKPENLKSAKVRLIDITLLSDDAAIKDVTIQFAGEKTGMQKIAFMDANGSVNIADKQENLASFFQDNFATIVADFDLSEDYYDDLKIEVKIIFQMEFTTN